MFFIKSWFGYSVKLLSTVESTEDYRNELVKFYKDEKNTEELINKAIKGYAGAVNGIAIGK